MGLPQFIKEQCLKIFDPIFWLNKFTWAPNEQAKTKLKTFAYKYLRKTCLDVRIVVGNADTWSQNCFTVKLVHKWHRLCVLSKKGSTNS